MGNLTVRIIPTKPRTAIVNIHTKTYSFLAKSNRGSLVLKSPISFILKCQNQLLSQMGSESLYLGL